MNNKSIGKCRLKTLWRAGMAALLTALLTSSALAMDVLYAFQSAPDWPGNILVASNGVIYGTSMFGGLDDTGLFFSVTPDGTVTQLASLTSFYGLQTPPLVEGPDGNFYGTSSEEGAVFRVTPSGVVTTLVTFTGTDGEPESPNGLLLGNDGNFYGTSSQGGSNDLGAIFEVTTNGSFTTLFSFDGTNGSFPSACLIQATDGNFYGTAGAGGAYSDGTVFVMTPGGQVTTLATFNNTNGASPESPLVQGRDGNFYGTTAFGGKLVDGSGMGTIFKMTPGGEITTLVKFIGTNGQNPGASGLVQGTNGNFFGTTVYGGNLKVQYGLGWGTVFEVTTNGDLTTLVSFDGANGASPYAGGLMMDTNGNLYGTTAYGGSGGLGTLFKLDEQGAFTNLVSFGVPGGFYLTHKLVQGSDGTFYGSASWGGIGVNSDDVIQDGGGTIFKMTPSGAVSTLVVMNGTNGTYPQDMVIGADGNIYGSTAYGGDLSLNYGEGSGTVFKMTPDGVLTTLGMFTENNGNVPDAGIVAHPDGFFYGTCETGGTGQGGTVFRFSTNGGLGAIVDFSDSAGQIRFPNALTVGKDGDLYCTTTYGGSSNQGAFIRITPIGQVSLLGSFNTNVGSYPDFGLVQGTDGNFYGTTTEGGANEEGTIFKADTNGNITLLYSFSATNGYLASPALVEGNDGNFYGITTDGGAYGQGTVYRISPAGAFATIINFDHTNGRQPQAPLIKASDGNLYGTASIDGPYNGGVIFRVFTDLNMTQTNNQSVITWATNAVGFNLQFATNLSSPVAWYDYTNAPAVAGLQFIVTNPISGNQFFRLTSSQ